MQNSSSFQCLCVLFQCDRMVHCIEVTEISEVVISEVGYFLRGSIKPRLYTHCGLLFLGLGNRWIIVVGYSFA